jgi:hypothetical protein
MNPKKTSPTEIQIEKMPGELRIDLPQRVLGNLRHFGWIAVAMGVFTVGFMFVWISMPLMGGIQMIQGGNFVFGLLMIGFASFGIFGLYFGKNFLIAGIGIVSDKTRASIIWKNDQLKVIEHLWFFKWKRKCKLDSIARLVFERPQELHPNDLAHRLPKKLECLMAYDDSTDEDKNGFAVVIGYDREITQTVAEELVPVIEAKFDSRPERADDVDSLRQSYAKLRTSRSANLAESREQRLSKGRRVEVVDQENVNNMKMVVPVKQPADSNIQFEQHEQAVVFNVPPRGVVKGSYGMVFFAVFWCGILSVMTFGFAMGVINGDNKIWELLFLIPFWLVGIGVAIYSVHLGKKRATIGASANALWIEKISIFGKKIHEIDRHEILAIVCGPSNVSVNDQPVPELKVCKTDGSHISLFSQMNEPELRWMEFELNQQLALQLDPNQLDWRQIQQDSAQGKAGKSRIEVENFGQHKRMFIPRDRFLRTLPGYLFLAIFIAVGCGAVVMGIIGAEIGAIIFGVIFGAIPIVICILGVIYSRRTFEITLDPKKMTIVRNGFFGQAQFQFDLLEPVEVLVPYLVNKTQGSNDAVHSFSIKSPAQKVSLMAGRNKHEILFAASTLKLWLEPHSRTAHATTTNQAAVV